MALTNIPQNPHNNSTPIMLDMENYADPFEIAALLKAKAGVPSEVLDRVHVDCLNKAKNNWLGFLDLYQMNLMFDTDYVQFTESTSPDYVIDDDGAVTRNGNEFTIDWSMVQGWEAGEDAWFYRVDDVVAIYDDAGNEELGVIESIDKANNTFVAKSRSGADWSVDTSNLTIDINGGDFDKGSCAPEGLLETRKTKSVVQKLQTIKDAMKVTGGKQYKICIDKDNYKWYSDNTLKFDRRFDIKVAKTLMKEVESADGSGAYLNGKYGSKGLFQNLRENALVHTGYITNVAGVQAITEYWDSLGFEGKSFIAHVDNVQYRYFEQIASAYAQSLGIQLQMVLNNGDACQYMKVGFCSLTIDGYTIHFTKWGLTTGNSDLGKKRIANAMPKGIIMPEGMVSTKINGVEKKVPYIFRMWQNLPLIQSGMVRTFFEGAGANINGKGSSCEFLKASKSTTVGIAVPCPEAITLID